jgi:hypothetical protein
MPGSAIIGTGSSTDLQLIPDCTVDYIFTDPPFGHNLQYGELNQRAEAWLGVFTQITPEAVISDSQHKDLGVYESIMTKCFKEFYRILKPGRWMTVEFHNSRNAVWNAIQESLSIAGFVIADVGTLDKKKGTTNQLFYSSGAVKQDLVITAYKPTEALERFFDSKAGTEEGAWEFLSNHLALLPVFVSKHDKNEMIPERQNYLLYDRMVAFHVQRGISVPLSASECYAGLRQRFLERDDMYFLPTQVNEYDQKRLEVGETEQLQLFVSDEKTAIQWVRQQLSKMPMSYADLQPMYMKEAQKVWDAHEQPLELQLILEQNCVKTANGMWRLPDPKKEADLEQIRHRALMKEFQQYVDTKGKLKVVRTEALRAGFKECWQKPDYPTIVQMAKRVPDAVIQEDPALLMYFDNALMRIGE